MKKTTLWALAMALTLALSVNTQAGENEEKHAHASKNPVVKIETSKGDILVELYQDKAPITVENFLKYTKEGLYNDKIFHRVIKGFMIQGGGITTDMVNKKPMPPIKNESYNKLRNKRGTLAMARTNAPDSATNQFFI
ncbi:MAG: peptidylprolyl isomerase, partial [Planctomycetota bacterium]